MPIRNKEKACAFRAIYNGMLRDRQPVEILRSVCKVLRPDLLEPWELLAVKNPRRIRAAKREAEKRL